jgi:hypothetical protein
MEQQRLEIAGCRRRIEEELGGTMHWFSYPVGGRQTFNDDTRRCLRDENITMAFNYSGGYYRFDDHWDEFDIPRIAVETHLSDNEFRAAIAFPQAFARRAS